MNCSNEILPFEPEEKLDWTEEERSSMMDLLDQTAQELRQKQNPSELETLLLSKLTPRRLQIILYRFGFVDGHLHSVQKPEHFSV